MSLYVVPTSAVAALSPPNPHKLRACLFTHYQWAQWRPALGYHFGTASYPPNGIAIVVECYV